MRVLLRLTHPRVFSFLEKRVKCIYFSFLLFFLIISCLRNVQNTQTSPQTVAMRQCPCPAALPIQKKLCCGHKKASHFWLSPIEYFSFWGRACHKNLIKKNKIISLTIKINTSRTLNGGPAAKDIMIRHTLYVLLKGDKTTEASKSSLAASPIRRGKMCE